MSIVRVTMRELLHNSRAVLAQVESGERVQITRRGRVVAVLSPPDASAAGMDDLVEAGHIAPGWRDRQDRLRTAPPGPASATEALLADRDA